MYASGKMPKTPKMTKKGATYRYGEIFGSSRRSRAPGVLRRKAGVAAATVPFVVNSNGAINTTLNEDLARRIAYFRDVDDGRRPDPTDPSKPHPHGPFNSLMELLLVLAIPATRNLVAIGEPTLYRTTPWQGVWAGTMWNEVGRGTIGVDIVMPPGFSARPLADQETFAREAALRFITDNPSRFALLTMKKIFWFWLPAYPEWSLVHKLWSGSYFLVLYGLAIVGLARMRRSAFAWVLVASMFGLLIPVALTLVDYDGRYRLPAEVCLVPLAAAGADPLLRRIRDLVAGYTTRGIGMGTMNRPPLER